MGEQLVITDVADITPEWLSEVLRRNELLGSGEVMGTKPLLAKTLQVSKVVRLLIEYSDEAPLTAPRTIFLKLSKPGAPVSNQSEIDFYTTVGSQPVGPLVRCYDAGFDSETNGSYLLLEDLSETHTQPENGTLPSTSQCQEVVKTLAEFHAGFWNHPDVGVTIGEVFDTEWLESFVSGLHHSVNTFLYHLGDDLSGERREIYNRLLSSSRMIWGRLTNRDGLTVTHGDVHWWNFLYPKDPSIDRTRIFDWQLWHIDLGARDLAFLLALGGFATEKSEIEMDLVSLYHRSLIENGVENYA